MRKVENLTSKSASGLVVMRPLFSQPLLSILSGGKS